LEVLRVKDGLYDLIVIGGGINGTGVARDAALRGMRVLLLEKNDFGAGTSAHSSRLIHGGLRYLAHMEFDLVYESLQERERLLNNAPHLVKPLAMAIPLYPGSKNPPLMVRVGMWLYDLLSCNKRMPPHRMLGRSAFLKQYPSVQDKNLLGGPVFYDAQADFPERICLENVLAAKETGNAELLNHTKVTAIHQDKAGLPRVEFQNVITGHSGRATSQALINASGPWVDAVLQSARGITPKKRTLIGGTKGSHIVIRKFAGGPDTALYAEAKSDGRPFFIIPWRTHYYLIGTTDAHFKGNLEQLAATRDEVEYLLEETNAILPAAGLSLDDVLYTYSGVRPLPYSDEPAGKVTRKHLIHNHAKEGFPRMFSLIGGKLTTYRRLAEEAVDLAIRQAHLKQANHQPWPHSPTGKLHLPGAEGIDDLALYKQKHLEKFRVRYGLPTETIASLINLYGSRAEAVLKLCEENPALKQPIEEHGAGIAAQVAYAVRTEMAQTLDDVMLRRLDTNIANPCAAAEVVSRIMAQELSWPEGKRQAEIAAYYQLIQQTALAFRNETVKQSTLRG
jgi:glycerol-3-phosphate dehydrogenase